MWSQRIFQLYAIAAQCFRCMVYVGPWLREGIMSRYSPPTSTVRITVRYRSTIRCYWMAFTLDIFRRISAPTLLVPTTCTRAQYRHRRVHIGASASRLLWPTWAAARSARIVRIPYFISPRGMLVKELIERQSRLRQNCLDQADREKKCGERGRHSCDLRPGRARTSALRMAAATDYNDP